MGFKELAAARYSVRKFKDRAVEKEKVDLILEAARNAPTAANKQPQRILVIDTDEELKKVDACTRFRFETSLVFLVCYDQNECWVRSFDGEKSGEVDASIVTTQMMLQAADIGLGTTWVMFFDPAKTREEFKLPPHIIPVAFLPTGYPADDAEPSDRHAVRHPLEKLII
ncbi:nitroreductase family protein [Leadbettera azotonutricia]|uniref:Nitroreductase family protein n=1 Tax=Leadbettera azotonutricia (strain ATCC BAA-888 / DSM 13862 / ZAS-9) TaxID=545695 RepID=F5YCG6_LEAAZ|nr:nitroreductase family protein [Leadbettera azotonutricia]AEF81101.1 nitroreductase family protein [Leadbettera azotonutricia ZAS-9]